VIKAKNDLTCGKTLEKENKGQSQKRNVSNNAEKNVEEWRCTRYTGEGYASRRNNSVDTKQGDSKSSHMHKSVESNETQ